MQASLSDMVSSPNSQTSHHRPIACKCHPTDHLTNFDPFWDSEFCYFSIRG